MERKRRVKVGISQAPSEDDVSLTAMLPAYDLDTFVIGAFGTIFNVIRDGLHHATAVSPSFEEVSFDFTKSNSAIVFLGDFDEFKNAMVARTFLMSQSILRIESSNLIPMSKFSPLYTREVQGWKIFAETDLSHSLSVRDIKNWDKNNHPQIQKSIIFNDIHYVRGHEIL